ncbi:hypothetical protein MCOR25_010166 [Pyricularia grisea]|nr:hypothetical protein MCOR25_010166 [Pyricularia grisea]
MHYKYATRTIQNANDKSDIYADKFHVSNFLASVRFRLLDFESRCIQDSNLDEVYVALSYVSPAAHMGFFRLSTKHIDTMYTTGLVDNVLSELPQSISDGIDFVKALGEKYLWVDALCVIHDDQHEMLQCGRLMTSIYRGSYLTLVAASETDASSGLSRRAYVSTHCQGPGQTQELNSYLPQSAYKKRGWSLGEIVLSRRIAVFVADRLFFSCQKSQRSIDTPLELPVFCLKSHDN